MSLILFRPLIINSLYRPPLMPAPIYSPIDWRFFLSKCIVASHQSSVGSWLRKRCQPYKGWKPVPLPAPRVPRPASFFTNGTHHLLPHIFYLSLSGNKIAAADDHFAGKKHDHDKACKRIGNARSPAGAGNPQRRNHHTI